MKQGLFLFFAFCEISNAYAQMDCESIPSCAELGYTQASCPEGNASLKCPFDETKFYCIGGKKLADAPAPVVTPEDWTAACTDKVDHCTAYNDDCKCTACAGDYNLANNTCVSKCDKSIASCAAENKIFKADTCTCEACPTNYLPVDGVCKKMCMVVSNCTTYDSEYAPCNCTACENGFTLENGTCITDPCFEKCKNIYPLFAGQRNTQNIVKAIGNKAYAVYAASQFYVGDKDGDFGQGKWYLPSIGEWTYFYRGQLAYTDDIVNKKMIDNALNTLENKGVKASKLNGDYWSSTEGTGLSNMWYSGNTAYWIASSGKTDTTWKIYSTERVRSSLLLKDCYNPSTGGTAPKVGEVMYLDKTYGSAEDYDGSKTPVGIITSVSKDGRDVTIINLKDLAFKHSYDPETDDSVYYFDPEDPYYNEENDDPIEKTTYIKWSQEEYNSGRIINYDHLNGAAKISDTCPCQFYPSNVSNICSAEKYCRNETTGKCDYCHQAIPDGCYDNPIEGYSCYTSSAFIGAGYGATGTKKTYYCCEEEESE